MSPGTAGSKVTTVTNTFRIHFQAKTIYRYVVEFEPEIPPEQNTHRRRVLGKFRRQVETTFGQHYYFDGTCLFSLAQVPNVNLERDSISVHIRFTNELSTRDHLSQEVNMVVNNMTKKKLRELNLISFARSYYYPEPYPVQVRYHQNVPEDQRVHLQLYRGFMATVQPSLSGMLMTVDLTSRVMRKESVREELEKYELIARGKGMSKMQYMEWMKSIYTGCVVLAPYNGRIWRIDEIDFTQTLKSTFNKRVKVDGVWGDSEVSYREYYTEHYPEIAHRLGSMKPGVLVNRPKKARTTKKETVLLPNLCYLTGQDDKMRANKTLMKALSNITRMSPNQRVEQIKKLMHDVFVKDTHTKKESKNKNGEPKKPKEPIPIKIDPQLQEIVARVLPPFAIKMPNSRQKRLDDNKGFSNDIRNAGFFGSRPQIRSWACVFDNRDRRTAQQVAQNIVAISRQQGAQLANANPVALNGNPRATKTWETAINQALTKKPQFILIIVPRGDELIYSFVKHWCAVQKGVVSQCMSTDTLKDFKMLKPICGNTFKQIMSKLGFHNWHVDINQHLPPAARKSTMFVGVDVSHDKLIKKSYGGTRAPRSTVGFTATHDESYNDFNSFISYQSKDTELITQAAELMHKALIGYHKANNKWPENVIVYRDGVGDSQLTLFVRKEIKDYEKAFDKLGISPKLTVIVCQKRINLRLFGQCPIASRTARRCPFNRRCNGRETYHSPMAGTIVDNIITSKTLSDFFLVPSIAPPNATARPTRFIVLRDDLKLQTDQIQMMTNQMCYMYFNWPGPIRVPACVMYAHKLAYLFGKHVTGEPNAALRNKLFYL